MDNEIKNDAVCCSVKKKKQIISCLYCEVGEILAMRKRTVCLLCPVQDSLCVMFGTGDQSERTVCVVCPAWKDGLCVVSGTVGQSVCCVRYGRTVSVLCPVR